jgi:hypothetical protein
MVIEAFDHLLLLKRGGNTVYFGPIGPLSHNLISYFEAGGASAFDQDANPTDWMLDVVAPSAGEPICDWAADRWIPSKNLEELDKVRVCCRGHLWPSWQALPNICGHGGQQCLTSVAVVLITAQQPKQRPLWPS